MCFTKGWNNKKYHINHGYTLIIKGVESRYAFEMSKIVSWCCIDVSELPIRQYVNIAIYLPSKILSNTSSLWYILVRLVWIIPGFLVQCWGDWGPRWRSGEIVKLHWLLILFAKLSNFLFRSLLLRRYFYLKFLNF